MPGYRAPMGRWWRYPVAVVVGLYLLSGLVWGTVGAVTARGWVGGLVNVVLYVLALGCAAVALRRDGLVPLAVAAAAGLVVQGLVDYAGTAILFLVAWLAPFRTGLWRALALTVVATAAFVVVSQTSGVPAPAAYGMAAGLGWSVFFAAVLDQLAETRRQTAAVAVARAGEAVLAERQRVAREIHDILAHSLSAQVVHLEGTRMLLERGEVGPALDRVVRAGEMARLGLDETKRAVAALRGDAGSLAAELASLASRSANPCEVTVVGDPSGLAPEARLAVVRTAQEALTNVHKHAPAASVTLTLRCHGSGCELSVVDNGGPAGALARSGGGYGLVGMRERAELIGGALDAGPAGDGFRVLLRVPA